jgi:hypothetical protein
MQFVQQLTEADPSFGVRTKAASQNADRPVLKYMKLVRANCGLSNRKLSIVQLVNLLDREVELLALDDPSVR